MTTSTSTNNSDAQIIYEIMLSQQELAMATLEARQALMHLRSLLELTDRIDITSEPDDPRRRITPLIPSALLGLRRPQARILVSSCHHSSPDSTRQITKKTVLEAICELIDDIDLLSVVAGSEQRPDPSTSAAAAQGDDATPAARQTLAVCHSDVLDLNQPDTTKSEAGLSPLATASCDSADVADDENSQEGHTSRQTDEVQSRQTSRRRVDRRGIRREVEETFWDNQ